MRIEFEATIEELVDLNMRLMRRSEEARSWIRQGAISSALLGIFINGILGLVIGYVLWGLPWAFIFAGFAAAIGATVSWLVHRDKIKQRYRNFFREKFGDRETFTFELEMRAAGIWTRQLGMQHMYEWAAVEELTIMEDAIEFYLYGGNGVSVKKRAFASTVEQQQFIAAARQHLNASRTSSNWLRDGESLDGMNPDESD